MVAPEGREVAGPRSEARILKGGCPATRSGTSSGVAGPRSEARILKVTVRLEHTAFGTGVAGPRSEARILKDCLPSEERSQYSRCRATIRG